MGSETRARLALGALLFATLVSFSQLFDGDAHFGPALLAALLATAVVIGARRLGASTPLVLALSGAALFWYVTLVFATPHLFYGLPTPGAAAALVRAVVRARETALLDFAPVPARPGYVLLLVLGIWVTATVAELATFRWRRPLVASAGPAALVSIVLVVGSSRGATLLVLMFLACLLTFWGMESSHRLRSWGRWVTPWQHRSEEPESLTGPLARKMGASCLAAAVIAPLLLPALDRGLLAWRSGLGSGPGLGAARRIDLLVSLAPTLVNQSDQELFRVTADRASYWRLTSLSKFDGQDWLRPEADLDPVPFGRVPTYEEPATRRVNLTQRYRITGLGDELLPAAATPSYVRFDEGEERETEDLAVDPETGELQVEGGLVEGLDYEVHSDVPEASYARLSRAKIGDPGPVFRELPQGISEAVFALADRWTEGATTPFEQLVAIQERLRAFEYSLDVKPEDSSDYLTQFLTETRAGYCQQFATAFAMLARIQGFPARVSVGFLPGTATESEGMRVVTGNEAHAWPEVYFEGYGWVPFEPTPRAGVGQPDYTLAGVVPGGPGGGVARTPEGQQPAARGVSNNPSICARRTSAPNTTPVCGDRQALLFTGRIRSRPAPLGEAPWAEAFDRLAAVAAVLGILFLVGVPLLKELRVRRRYREAEDPVARTRAAFGQFLSDAAELAAPRRPSESPAAYARRLVAANRAPRRAALALAALFEAAEYGPGAMSSRQEVEARRLAGQLRGALWSSATWWQRAVRLFAPASLLPAPRARRSGRARRMALVAGWLRAGRAG